jgi:predicted amidohydrolase
MSLRIYAAIVTGRLTKNQQDEVGALDGLNNARYRMEILEPLIKDAYREIKDHETKNPAPDSVQRIFMAPEYYFSRQQQKDARFFDESVRGWILFKLRALARQCPDLLIVPGTVLWSSQALTSPTQVQKQALAKGASPKDAFKQAVLVAELKNKPRIQAMQESLSKGQPDWQYSPSVAPVRAQALNPVALLGPNPMPLDVAFNTAYVLLGSTVLEYNKTGNYKEVKGEAKPLVFFSGGIKGIFSLGGIRYGLEICLDHNIGVLADVTNPQRKPVDVHLIVSDSVQFKQSDAKVIFHSSTVPKGTPVLGSGGRPELARTDPVLAQPGVTLASQFGLKGSPVTVYVVDVPNLNASGSNLTGITVHLPDAWVA